MPYRFSDEQRRLRETLRSFAREEVIPGAGERDRTGTYPAELVARLADLGLMGITIPEEYGGQGLDTPTQLVAIEEVAYGDAALASIYTGHYLGMITAPVRQSRPVAQFHLAVLRLVDGGVIRRVGNIHD